MPISYRIDLERSLALTTASGTLTDDDVLQLKTRLLRDPDFRPGMKELSDIRSIDHLDVTPAGVRAVVQQDKRDRAHVASHKLARVLATEVAFGLVRMSQILTQSTMENVGVVRNIDEANAWLQME